MKISQSTSLVGVRTSLNPKQNLIDKLKTDKKIKSPSLIFYFILCILSRAMLLFIKDKLNYQNYSLTHLNDQN